jgi:hypothetical protein
MGDHFPSLVLRTIVQERRDRLVLGAAVLQNQAADREEVGDVRRRGCLARLRSVLVDRELNRIVEPAGQHRSAIRSLVRVHGAGSPAERWRALSCR